MTNHEIKYLSLSQEDLVEAGAFDLVMAMETLESGLYRYRDGSILFPDKIVQIFNEETQERIRKNTEYWNQWYLGTVDSENYIWAGIRKVAILQSMQRLWQVR